MVVMREEEGEMVIMIIAAPQSFTPVVRTRQMIDPGIVYKSMTGVESG